MADKAKNKESIAEEVATITIKCEPTFRHTLVRGLEYPTYKPVGSQRLPAKGEEIFVECEHATLHGIVKDIKYGNIVLSSIPLKGE